MAKKAKGCKKCGVKIGRDTSSDFISEVSIESLSRFDQMIALVQFSQEATVDMDGVIRHFIASEVTNLPYWVIYSLLKVQPNLVFFLDQNENHFKAVYPDIA